MKTLGKGCFKAGSEGSEGNFTNKNDLKETFLNWKFSELKYSMSASKGNTSQLQGRPDPNKGKELWFLVKLSIGGFKFVENLS